MSIRSRGIPPRQFPVQQRPMAPMVSQVQQVPQPQAMPQPPRAQLPYAAMGDPGYGGANAGFSPADLRRALSPIENMLGELQGRLQQVEGSAASMAVVQEMLRSQPQNGFSGDMLGALGQPVIEAIRLGRALPYVISIEVFVPKGSTGVTLPAGEIFISSDGPVFITGMTAYAQIDPDDPDAINFPYSLIKSPSCCPGSNDPFAIDPNASTFTATPTSLLPGIFVGGMFIPISPKDCRLISSGLSSTCFTLDCANGSEPRSFNAEVPVLTLDHPECLDGLVDIQTNGCSWQNQSFPLEFLADAQFNITESTPQDVIGIVGYLDCNKRIDVRFQPTRPHKFDVNVTFVFFGFRVITCGVGGCGVG